MIEQKIAEIRGRIACAAERSGRSPAGITLVAVTKTFPVENVREALTAGIKDIGESRIQEAQPKFEQLGGALERVRKHLIGHLQTNKAKKAVELCDMIQSVDSLRLAQEINKHAAASAKVRDCLLEVKVSGEETKFGLSPEEIRGVAAQVGELSSIRVCGLMAMAPYFDDPEQARPYFRHAKEIFNKLSSSFDPSQFTVLSMGMSNDFEVAIEEGSTLVRIGTAIFGER